MFKMAGKSTGPTILSNKLITKQQQQKGVVFYTLYLAS